MHNTLVNPELALYNGLRRISFFSNATDVDAVDRIMGYYILGTIYKDLKKYKEAEHYYKTGIADEAAIQTTWGGRIFTGLANIYMYNEQYGQAVDMSLKGLEILRAEKYIR